MVEPNGHDLKRHGARPDVNPASESKEVLRQKRLILEEDERLDEVEEVDQLLADQQRMQCPDWERAQDADSVIKRMKRNMATLHPLKNSYFRSWRRLKTSVSIGTCWKSLMAL